MCVPSIGSLLNQLTPGTSVKGIYRPRDGKGRLRHRVPHPLHWKTPVYRSQRPPLWLDYRHAVRNSLLAKQARRLHPRESLSSPTTKTLRAMCGGPFTKEPDLGVTSVNYNLTELLMKATHPF